MKTSSKSIKKVEKIVFDKEKFSSEILTKIKKKNLETSTSTHVTQTKNTSFSNKNLYYVPTTTQGSNNEIVNNRKKSLNQTAKDFRNKKDRKSNDLNIYDLYKQCFKRTEVEMKEPNALYKKYDDNDIILLKNRIKQEEQQILLCRNEKQVLENEIFQIENGQLKKFENISKDIEKYKKINEMYLGNCSKLAEEVIKLRNELQKYSKNS